MGDSWKLGALLIDTLRGVLVGIGIGGGGAGLVFRARGVVRGDNEEFFKRIKDNEKLFSLPRFIHI